MSDTAKVFWSGRSQAVRLPKEFRFDGEEVHIRREGSRVILTPVGDDYKVEDIGLDVSRGIAELRQLIREGEDESGDAEWNLDEAIRSARREFEGGERD